MCSLSLVLIAFRCDFVAPHRIIEPPSSNVNNSEAKEPSVATSLKVLEPPSSLQRLADYRKKMMIDVEGPVAPASVSRSDSIVSTDISDRKVSLGASPSVLHVQTETERTEHPNSPVALTLVSNPCEPTPLPSNGRKLDSETVAVHLPAAVVAPSKVTPEPVNTQLAPEQDVAPKPELAITVPVSTPVPTSLADSVSDAPVVFLLEEPAVCSAVDVGMSEQEQLDSCNVVASPVKVQKIVKLPAEPSVRSAVDVGTSEQKQLNSCNVVASPVKVQKIVKLRAESQASLTGEDLSLSVCRMTSIVPSPSTSLLIEATSKKTTTVRVQKVYPSANSQKRKPVINSDNLVTNYFRPVSIVLTADGDKVDASRTGSARTIHLNVENSGNDTGTMAAHELKTHQHTMEATQIVPKHPKVVEECPPPSLPCVKVKITTKDDDETCEVSDGKQVSSPLKVVVERVKDITLNETLSALEIMTPLNTECKEVPSREVSSRCRRKIKSPVKRNAGDRKLPPFKGCSKRVQPKKTRKRHRKVLLQDKLSESYGKCSKKEASEKPKALKSPSQNQSGTKNGNDDQVMDLTRQEAVTGPETTSRDNPSPSLLPAASGRTASKTKHIKSTNRISEVIENDVAIEEDVKMSKLSTTGSQPEQILNSDTILDDVNTNKHSGSKCHINNSAHNRQVRNDNLSPLCDKEQICDIESFKQNVASSHRLLNTSVREVSGDTHGNGSSNPASNEVADGEVTERSMLDSAECLMPNLEMRENLASNKVADGEVTERSCAEFLIPHLEMQETNKKLIKSNSCQSKMSLRSAKKDIQDMKMVDQNTPRKANMLKADSDAERKDVIFTKQNISDSHDGFSDSLGEVLAERTCSSISKTDATLPCVQMQNNSTSPHEVHKGSGKAADSQDVIESSQDSNSSLLIASKLPLMQKCSVSVCRINTTLGPGATISVPDGHSRHIVLTPDSSGSPFKVYKDKPASPKQRKSAEALSELGRAHGMTRRSAVQSLIDKFADVTEVDSIQDKPSMSLGINPSRGESAEHPATESCASEEVNGSRSEDSNSTAGKEDTPKPQSMEKINLSVSKDNIMVVIVKETLKQQADEKFRASESEDCILPCCKEDSTQPHSGQEINMSQCEDIVVKKEKEGIGESWSKQQLSTGDSNDNHLSSAEEDTQECHSKQDINKSALEDTQLTSVGQNASKRKRKRQFNASNCDGRVLKLLKEDIPRPEQQRSETFGLTAAKEGPLKPRATEHTVASKCEVISLAEVLKGRLKHDSPEYEPEQQNTMLKPENKKTTIMKKDAEKSELNSSNCAEITGMRVTYDTTELRPKRIGMGKKTKNNSRVKIYASKRSTNLVLRSSSVRMLTEDECMEDLPQQLVAPDSDSTNQCQRNSDKQTKDDNLSLVGHNISSPLKEQKISDKSGVTDNTSGVKKTPLNESNILDGNFKVPFPVHSRKRRASPEVPHRQAATTLNNPDDTGASKIKKLSMQNSEDEGLYAKPVCDRSVGAPSEVKLCDVASSDCDETPSSPSSKSLIRSPGLLLRSFCSVLGNPESRERHKSHYKCLRGGRARYLLDCAGAAKDTGTWSDVCPEEIKSVYSGAQPSLPPPRTFHVYSVSGGGSSHLGT